VTGLVARPRLAAARRRPGARGADLWWPLAAGGPAALLLAVLLMYSVQAACAFALVALVVGLHQYDRRWGVAAMFALWLLVPGLRRVLGLMTGFVGNDPLSLAPFAATAAIAALELVQVHVPSRVRVILLVAAGGFAVGLPVGFLAGPRAAVYACGAYVAGLSALVLGFNERGTSLRDSTLRSVLLYGMPAIAVYAILQRVLPVPVWDQAWLDATDFNSIGAPAEGEVRVFASLNSPGALAPLLGFSLLCYLTVRPRHPSVAVLGATLLTVALALTFVRSAWISLMVAALAHVIASRGASARLVFGSAAVAVAVTLALAPVNSTAREVVDRFNTIGNLSVDESATERSATLSGSLPSSLEAPLGHGLGTAGEPSKLTGGERLRTPDNGYLALIYQIGPIGFLLVVGAAAWMLRAAWIGARDRAPGQELRLLLFAIYVFTLVQMGSGDQFYGSNAVIFWFVGGQVLAYELMRRRGARAAPVRAGQ
jgi:O-antigen ligase